VHRTLKAWARGLAVVAAIGVTVVLPSTVAAEVSAAPAAQTAPAVAPGAPIQTMSAPSDWVWT
jgi:hypothetical protein